MQALPPLPHSHCEHVSKPWLWYSHTVYTYIHTYIHTYRNSPPKGHPQGANERLMGHISTYVALNARIRVFI
jgi:hypothetical protein